MIDVEVLEQQRREIERLRLAAERDRVWAERIEAALALRRAQLEAVRLGLRRECANGCGREIAKCNRSGYCTRCTRTLWQRWKRTGTREKAVLRLVSEPAREGEGT